MRGWLVEEKGSARYVDDLPEPVLGPGEMIVQVDAAAANYADRLLIDGKHQIRPKRPFVAGLEVAGTVIESDAADHPVGSLVTGLVEPGSGCWAERCRCSPGGVMIVPPGVDPVDNRVIRSNRVRQQKALARVVLYRLLNFGSAFAICPDDPFRIGAVDIGDHVAQRIVNDE